MASYVAVDQIVLGTRAAGDVRGQVSIALLKQAAVRILAIGATDPKEAYVCRLILDNSMPATWSTMVLEALDIQGTLGTHTDAQVDAAVALAWSYFLAARQVG